MGFIRGLALFFLSIIVIFLILLSSFSFAANSLLYPDIYYKSLQNSGLYVYLDNEIKSQGMNVISISGGSKQAIESALSNFLSYLRSDTQELDLFLILNTSELNPSLPELKEFNVSFNEEEKIDLVELFDLSIGSPNRKSLDEFRNYISLYRLSNILLIVIASMMLFLIYLLKMPNTKGFLRLSSTCFFFSALFLSSILYLINQIPKYIKSSEDITVEIFSAILDVIGEILILHILVILSISLVFFIISFIVRDKNIKNNKSNNNKK